MIAWRGGRVSKNSRHRKLRFRSALMVSFAATACSGSDSTTSEETTASQATPGEATTAEGYAAEGSAAEMEAAVESAMEENDLKAVLVRVTQNGEEVATVVRGESMTGVPATEEMHFRNGAVSISYLG